MVTARVQLPSKGLIGLPHKVAKLWCGVMWLGTKCMSAWSTACTLLFRSFCRSNLTLAPWLRACWRTGFIILYQPC